MGKTSALDAVIAAIASFVAVSLFISFLCCIFKSRGKANRRAQIRSRSISHAANERHHLSSIAVDESHSFDHSLRLSMADLRSATRNFSPDLIVGDGGFGLVYRACLNNGHIVAIKKLEPDAFQGHREFRAEMETLSKLQHPNIVKILGYCESNRDRVLVYEFIERGNLDQWLHDTLEENYNPIGSREGDVSWSRQSFEKLPLSWDNRMKIIGGVACGLAYLHGLPTPIIHRDIKASNVLLDADFEAHIADFGLARRIEASHSHVSTQWAGTMGYMPPEYKEGFTAATVKADVYSFGILMLEIMTGRRPNLPVRDKGDEVGLIFWARDLLAHDRQMEMVDPNVSRDGLEEVRVRECFRIACLCASDRPKERPDTSQVLGLLDSALGLKIT